MEALISKTSWFDYTETFWVDRIAKENSPITWESEEECRKRTKNHLKEMQKEYPTLSFKMERIEQNGKWAWDLPRNKTENRIVYFIKVKFKDLKELMKKEELIIGKNEDGLSVDFNIEIYDTRREA